MEFGVEIGEYRGAKFSRTGCEQLLNQLFGFGAEKDAKPILRSSSTTQSAVTSARSARFALAFSISAAT